MSERSRRILVVDDEQTLLGLLEEALREAGFAVRTARDATDALSLIQRETFDVALVDIRMPGKSGLELLPEIKAFSPRIEVIIITSHVSLDATLEALRKGAYDFLLKPFPSLDVVVRAVQRAIEQVRLVEKNDDLVRRLEEMNLQLAESNELHVGRAQTVETLLDYTMKISQLFSPERFASETAVALSKLAAGRHAVVYRLARDPVELVPIAAAGIARSAIPPIPAPPQLKENELVAWLEGLERENTIGKTAARPPCPASYVAAITAGSRVTGAVAVLQPISAVFPPSVRSVLDRFMYQVRQISESISLHETMRSLAVRDGLTGLYNHRYFRDRFAEEFARARRYGHALSLLFIDIDHFKQINDTHGHVRGDVLLKELAVLIRGSGRHSDISAIGSALATSDTGIDAVVLPLPGRESDIAARYGGEEFVVILTETSQEGAGVRAERLRKMVAEAEFAAGSGAAIRATVSIGLTSLTEAHRSAEAMIMAADAAMYDAKKGGRNRVCGSSAPPQAASS